MLPLQRTLIEAQALLSARTPDLLTTELLVEARNLLGRLSDEFGQAYFR